MPSVLVKYNEHHDELGRFTSGGGESSTSLARIAGKDHAPKRFGPVSVDVYRTGSVREGSGRGVFFGQSVETVAGYRSGRSVDAYRVEAENAFIARDHQQLYQHLFGDSFRDAAEVEGSTSEGVVRLEVKMADKLRSMGYDALIYGKTYQTGEPEIAILNFDTAKARKLKVSKFNPNHDERGRFTTGSGSVAEVVSQHEALANSSLSSELTPDEKIAVYSYTTVGNRPINEVLRRGKQPSAMVQRLISNLSSALDKSTLSQPITVYRHLTEGSYNRLLEHMGGEFIDKGFLSTTTDKSHPYYRYQPPNLVGYAAEISLPKGAKALPIAHLTSEGRADEAEVLVNRGSRFRIEKSTSGRPKAIKMTWLGTGR